MRKAKIPYMLLLFRSFYQLARNPCSNEESFYFKYQNPNLANANGHVLKQVEDYMSANFELRIEWFFIRNDKNGHVFEWRTQSLKDLIDPMPIKFSD
ncbi:hypothetical protein CDL15_Pgr010484 [Punica granatum]|nr:hypothetical protein CDL15_Pgr010484 [Punica granatum]